MVALAPSVDGTRHRFPYLTSPKKVGPPTFDTIKAAHLKSKTNIVSIPSVLGSGAHGLVALLSPTQCITP